MTYSPSIQKDPKPGICAVSQYWSEGLAHGWTPCYRTAKGTLEIGHPACGIHLAAERRHNAKNAEYDAKRRASNEAEILAKELVSHLATVGLSAGPAYSSKRFAYTGEVILQLNAEQVADLVERLQR